VVESVKAVSDLYAPVTGRVLDVNDALRDAPELVNSDAYGDGWMLRVELADDGELDQLMDSAAYAEQTA
jgi:glycine cleavage system H protein